MQLKRELNWWDCSAIIVGIIIGSGIFAIFPKLVALKTGSTLLILLAWFIGGIFAWFGAMSYAELSSIFPHAGGDYTFLNKSYSLKGETLVSFLFGWTQVIVIRPASIVILALIFAKELQFLTPKLSSIIPTPTLFYSIVLIASTTIINILGINTSKTVQNIITILKVGILVAFIIIGFYKSLSANINFSPIFLPPGKPASKIFSEFISAIVLVMWVYGGWNEAAYVAEEVKNPSKNIPKALFVGIFSVIILYMGINYVFIANFSPTGLANTISPASSLMEIWFGGKGKIIMSSVILISAAGAVNALTMTGGRMIYGITKTTESLDLFSKIHPTLKTPVFSLILNFMLSLILIIISKGNSDFVDNLTFYTGGVYWYFFALVIISLIIFRSKLDPKDIPFKVPFYPISPIAFLIISGVLIWGAFDYKPIETLIGISILTIGIPIYYLINISVENEKNKTAR